MTKPITGIHHITAMASDPQRNIDFYHSILGQRFIKSTVNFDDPNTHHLYYGDRIGTPGTILTFFPWPGARRGRLGIGETSSVAYSIHPDSVEYWLDRLQRYDISVGKLQTRFGQTVIPFSDPDGMRLELIADNRSIEIDFWQDGPIPQEHALKGFHGVTLLVADIMPSAQLLTETMGFTLTSQERDRARFQAGSDSPGLYVDLLGVSGISRGQMGAGTVHHIAFRARDDQEQISYQTSIAQTGLNITPVRDRQYFRSIYFREPGGVLFEIATDDPGFTIDEPAEALGTNLKLPPWYEKQREAIEEALPPITIPEISYA
jgi:glyoxalase family protein